LNDLRREIKGAVVTSDHSLTITQTEAGVTYAIAGCNYDNDPNWHTGDVVAGPAIYLRVFRMHDLIATHPGSNGSTATDRNSIAYSLYAHVDAAGSGGTYRPNRGNSFDSITWSCINKAQTLKLLVSADDGVTVPNDRQAADLASICSRF
jgi:hypothetical protein